jgi:hypothetical protein
VCLLDLIGQLVPLVTTFKNQLLPPLKLKIKVLILGNKLNTTLKKIQLVKRDNIEKKFEFINSHQTLNIQCFGREENELQQIILNHFFFLNTKMHSLSPKNPSP